MPSNINTSDIFHSNTKVYEYNFLMIYENIEKASDKIYIIYAMSNILYFICDVQYFMRMF